MPIPPGTALECIPSVPLLGPAAPPRSKLSAGGPSFNKEWRNELCDWIPCRCCSSGPLEMLQGLRPPPCFCSRSLGVSPQNLELACEESAQESFGPRCLCPPGLSGSPQWAPTLPHTPGNRHTYFRTFNIYNCFGQPPFLVVQSPLLRPQDPTGLSRLTCSVSGPSTHRHAPGVGEPDICL